MYRAYSLFVISQDKRWDVSSILFTLQLNLIVAIKRFLFLRRMFYLSDFEELDRYTLRQLQLRMFADKNEYKKISPRNY